MTRPYLYHSARGPLKEPRAPTADRTKGTRQGRLRDLFRTSRIGAFICYADSIVVTANVPLSPSKFYVPEIRHFEQNGFVRLNAEKGGHKKR
jgi:hypothetical protein